MDFKKILKKVWHFIWHEESLASWIVNIILAFIIVKFIFYPGVGLLLNTSYPIVAVVSSSMEHNTNFDSWYEKNQAFYFSYNITKEDFSKFSFKDGFNKGDIMIIFGKNPKDIKIGDIIVFRGSLSDPIIHRVIKKEETLQTKGDNNPDSRNDEKKIDNSVLLGKAILRIPLLGWIKIIAIDLINLIK